MTNDSQINYTVANDDELNLLVSGIPTELGMPLPKNKMWPRVTPGSTGVIWESTRSRTNFARPLALIIHENDQRRLYGRFSQIRSEFSPISTWCHVLTADQAQHLEAVGRASGLGGFEAAWSGLAIAEASLLTGVPVAKLRTSSCFATQTFAVAKTQALWPKASVGEVCEKLYQLRRVVGVDDRKLSSLNKPLSPIWATLAAVSTGSRIDPVLQPLVDAVIMLAEARARHDENEAQFFAVALSDVIEEASFMEHFLQEGPENRLAFFDHLVYQIRSEAQPRGQNSTLQVQSLRQEALALLAGYIATVAAGGSSSMALLNDTAGSFPQITGWAYSLGGIGAPASWTSGFEGLGRFVARELLRSFRLDNPPDCDFSLDEAVTLVDKALAEPLVHLKIKQARSISVSIYPGVNVIVPFHDAAQQDERLSQRGAPRSPAVPALDRARTPSDDLLDALADAVFARVEARLNDKLRPSQSNRVSSTTKNRRTPRSKALDE